MKNGRKVLCYVDDMLILCCQENERNDLKSGIQKKFRHKGLVHLTQFLGTGLL